MYQKLTIVGNLGKKPEIRYLDSGTAVANFNVATGERYTNKNGDKVETTEWFRCEAWSKTAEVVEKYLDKGSKVLVEGRIKTEKYTDKDNVERTATKVRVDRLLMLDSKPQSKSSGLQQEWQKQVTEAEKTKEQKPPNDQAPLPGFNDMPPEPDDLSF
jgi:single-strand DNA-binding protein